MRKCGITTDLTTGQITKVGVWCSSHGMCVFTGLEMVQGWPTPNTSQRFSAPGDSGSVVVDDDDKVVGLHYAGTQTAPFTSSSNDIRRVRQRIGEFQIPIPNPFQMVQLLGDDGRLARYRSELERTGHGREILAAFVENVGEGIRLVNSNRACMVAWQRFKAPAFISVRKGLDVDEPYVLRKEIDGVALDEMLTTMRQLFIEHGSPRMAEALRKHADEMIQLVQDHDSVDDVVKAVGTPRE